MAKPLYVQTDRSPKLEMPMSLTDGGEALTIGTGGTVNFHTIPEGYKDKIYAWYNNINASTDGQVVVRLGDAAANDIRVDAPAATIVPILDGHVMEGKAGGRTLNALAVTQQGKIWGYVVRTPIES